MKKNLTFIFVFLLFLQHFSQVGIGTDTPHPSALLDLNSSNKGILLPKITLGSDTDVSVIATPAEGLLVFNTGENANFPYRGYMFWNGAEWRLITDGVTIKPVIESGKIVSALLTPNAYTLDTPYNGYLEVNYTGGNGGYYSKGEAYTYGGLTFELQPGKLETTTGKLVYKVAGEPLVSFPAKITGVPINFSGATLGTIDIGGAETIQSAQYTLYDEINTVAQGVNGTSGVEKGYGGSLLKWGKNGQLQEIILPETGSYSFAFRLYGTAANSSNTDNIGMPFYISAFKQTGASPHLPASSGGTITMNDTLLDIAEMTVMKPKGYTAMTYSINLTISGKAGDKVYFKISSVGMPVKFDWVLRNGGRNDKVANRTSMIFWKL